MSSPVNVYMPHSGTYHLVDPQNLSTVRGIMSTDTARCGSTLHGGSVLDEAPGAYTVCPVCAGMTGQERFANIEQIKKANEEAGQHWFSPNTLLFFASKVESGVINGRFFVTSEKNFDGTKRLFSVRRANDDGTIDTVGDFQAYSTRQEALEAAESQEG